MTDTEKLKKIREWAESDHSYLSNIPGWARGYREGINQAKKTVLEILNLVTYTEVRTDFFDEEKQATAVDAWTDPDEDDNGRTVAWVHTDGTVEWVVKAAENDPLVKAAIRDIAKATL